MSKHGTQSTQVQPEFRKRTVHLADRVWFKNGATPLMTMLKKKGNTDTAQNQKVEWARSSRPDNLVTVAPAVAGDTVLTISTGDNSVVLINSILSVPETGEQIRVIGKTAPDKINVVRGFGATAAGAIAGTLMYLSNASGEGTNSPEGTVYTQDGDYNYCQIFKDAVKITRNELKSPRYAENGDKRVFRRGKVLEEHKKKIEKQFIFGERQKTLDSDGNDLYIAGGVRSFISTNKPSLPANFKYSDLNATLGDIATIGGGGDLVMFCGSEILNVIADTGFQKQVLNDRTNDFYGVDITEIITGYGKISVVFHPMISQYNPKQALLLDLNEIVYTTIDDTKIEQNVQAPDYDGIKDQILTDATIEVHNEECHALYTMA